MGCICGESAEAKQGDFCQVEGTITPKCAATAELCTMEGDLSTNCRVKKICMCSEDELAVG